MVIDKLGFEISNHYYKIEEIYRCDMRDIQKIDPGLIAIGLVNDEGDLIEAWLGHLCSLFDLIYLVDHNSSDGTYEIILEAARETGKINVCRFTSPGYFQKEIMDEVIRAVSKDFQNAWIFPCDADEFFPYTCGVRFRDFVLANNKNDILRFTWKNCMPLSLLTDQKLDCNTLVLKPPYYGNYHKVAFHSSKFLINSWQISRGNHTLLDLNGEAVTDAPYVEMGELLHFPFRSLDQFVYKMIRSFKAKNRIPAHIRNPNQGFHIPDMMNRIIETGIFSPQVVRGFIANYGVKTSSSSFAPMEIYELIRNNWFSGCFDVDHSTFNNSQVQRKKYSSLVEKELTNLQDDVLEKFINVINGSGLIAN